MKTVMCFGTFDILHPGHLNYFEQAKKHGDYLVVVIARDKTKADQGKSVFHTEQERLQLVRQCPLVDEAVLGNYGDHFKIIIEKKPDMLCLGYDQKVDERELSQKLASCSLTPNIYRATAHHPEKYKTSIFYGKEGQKV